MTDEDVTASASQFSRRKFLKRMAGVAFAAPVVASFTLDATRPHAAAEQQTAFYGNQIVFGNQYLSSPNQFFANQVRPTDDFLSQAQVQAFPNEYYPNQLH